MLVNIICALAIVGIVALLYHSDAKDKTTQNGYMLRLGQSFASTDDYLRLFGVTESPTPWSVALPHHQGIIIWGPEYNHPEWHNEGNTDSLCPTILEYWQPIDTTTNTAEAVKMRNADNYLRVTSFKELRVTFMKNVQDSTYTFIGVYRLDPQHSDSTRLMWQRVLDYCDLHQLDYLEQLRL